jgi:WD40 repeat protein/serine/threonine protein kinase
MAIVSACPDVAVLQQLAMGRMPPHEVEYLAKHCEQCPRCIQALHTMKLDDTLIEAMAAQSTAPHRACADAVHSLIERLKQMPSPVPAPELSATIGAESTPPASIETTQAGDISLAPPQAADEIGRLGGYRVLKMLGAGGMGMVYQAEDVHLQRPIALKVMKAEVAKNPGNRERFLREARAAAKLKSDHVVTIHQVGEDNQVVFLAMEYLEGMSLDDWMKKGRKPSLAQTVRIGRQIALGLADAHACGLIHRDIKPGNIWLDNRHQGRVKLLDFGLARGTTEEVHLTQSGAIVGTPAYMAPEQARSEKVDHRVDLFSLGVVLYRLTTGQLPFRGDNTMSILTALALDTPKPPREINADIPPHLAELIERLLSKDREQRPATAKAVADELSQIEREATQPATEERTLQVGAASVSVPVASPAPLRSRLIPRLRYGLRKYVVAASLLLLLGGMAAAIVVIIRDKQGKKIAEVEVPPGGSAEIKDKGEGKANVLAKEEVRIAAAALPPLLPGEPLSPTALVRQPAKLPGARSWSIETRAVAFANAVAYRPDGKRLAVGSQDGSIRIWEPESGRLVQLLLGRTAILSLAWSPDGRVLATGITANKLPVQLWEAETGRFLRSLESPTEQEIPALSWSSDGRSVLAYTLHARTCLAWDAANGKLLRQFPTDAGSVCFSPDGKRFAGIRLSNSDVWVWDAESGKEVRKLGDCKILDVPSLVAWSPDGKRLAYGGAEGLRIVGVETGKEILLHKSEVGAGGIQWSPDGRTLAFSLRWNRGVRLLDVAEGAKPRSLDDLGGSLCVWSPDGKMLARIHSEWGWVRLYDAATGKRVRTLSEGMGANGYWAAFAPDGRVVAAKEIWGDSPTLISSADTGQIVASLKDAVGPIIWSPDGNTVATRGPGNNSLVLWDSTGKLRFTMAAHPSGADWLAFSPDGKRLASASVAEKEILLWDAEKGVKLRALGPFEGPGESLCWSPNGRLLAFNVPNIGWHFWDVEKNKLANDPKQWAWQRFHFAPDDRTALTLRDWNDTYRLRDLATGKELRQVGSLRPMSPAWAPSGNLLALPTDSAVELWRVTPPHRLRTLKATQGVQHVSFSTDGKLILGASSNHLYVWEADTGRQRGIVFLGEKNNALTIAADGHYNGNDQVERGILMVVQKDDGTQEVLEPADFEQKYGWKNEPDKVHLLNPLPPPPYPLPGQPMGPFALVREPAELPNANALSWTVESVNSRGAVYAVAYRPDGKQLATGGDDGTIRIWDTADGKLVRMLVGEPVGSLSWAKDGKVLTAFRPGDNKVCEWDADTGRLLRCITVAVIPGTKTARSPDGKQTVTADGKGVRITDTATGKVLHTLEETGQVGFYGLSWSPDGRSLALGYAFPGESGLRIVEAATGRPRPLSTDYERAGAWSPDGKTFAAFRRHGRVHLLVADTYRQLRTLEGDGGDCTAMAWSADGKRLALSAYSAVRVWSGQTGKQLWQKDKRGIAVAWSPDGRRLATTDNSNEKAALRLWEAETGKLLCEHPLIAEGALAWTPDGKRLVALPMWGEEGLLIDAETGALHRKLKAGVGNCCVHWSSDGKTFTSLGNQGQLWEWNAATGEARRTTQLPGVVGFISSAAWSSDGQMLAWASGGGIHLSDAAGEPLGALMPVGPYAQLAITADGRYRGNARVERSIRMVVQKRDGSSETLTPSEFEHKYGFKNEPDKVRLTEK